MPWLLIFIGLILVILNVLAIKKHNRTFNGALGNAMVNIDDEDIRIGELRREFSESILELQSEIVAMKEDMKKNNELVKNYKIHLDEEKSNLTEIKENDNVNMYIEKEIIIEPPIISNSNNEKIQKIKKMFADGLSEDSIAEALHLGKGEVLLIKDLYIR